MKYLKHDAKYSLSKVCNMCKRNISLRLKCYLQFISITFHFHFKFVTMKSSRLNFVPAQFLVNFKKIYNWHGLKKLKNYCQTVTKNVGWIVYFQINHYQLHLHNFYSYNLKHHQKILDVFEHNDAINTNNSSSKYHKLAENHFFLP